MMFVSMIELEANKVSRPTSTPTSCASCCFKKAAPNRPCCALGWRKKPFASHADVILVTLTKLRDIVPTTDFQVDVRVK